MCVCAPCEFTCLCLYAIAALRLFTLAPSRGYAPYTRALVRLYNLYESGMPIHQPQRGVVIEL